MGVQEGKYEKRPDKKKVLKEDKAEYIQALVNSEKMMITFFYGRKQPIGIEKTPSSRLWAKPVAVRTMRQAGFFRPERAILSLSFFKVFAPASSWA